MVKEESAGSTAEESAEQEMKAKVHTASAEVPVPKRRTLVTNIDKPMNHVRISERVTSGKTRINKESIRVMHNGIDVTDNCIIKMEKDGFTVDTQMNTNEGDSFVTTYEATSEDGEDVSSTTTALADEPVDEVPVQEDERPVTKQNSQRRHVFPTGLAVAAVLIIGTAVTESVSLLKKHKIDLGGNLCRISNLVLGKPNG